MFKQESKRKITTSKIALYGMLMGLTVIATMVISIPMIATQGYINLGDGLVLLSGTILGPLGGFIVGGLGSALADVLLGYAYYAPFTLIIKGIEGAIGVTLFKKLFKEDKLFISMAIGGLLMAVGYLIVEIFLYGYPAAIASFPGNIIQGQVGAILASLLYKNIINRI